VPSRPVPTLSVGLAEVPLAVLAAIADEREEVELALPSERVERHLHRQAAAGPEAASERHARPVALPDDPADEVSELWKLSGVNPGDRSLEQLFVRQAEQLGSGRIGRDDAVSVRVQDQGCIPRALEEALEPPTRRGHDA